MTDENTQSKRRGVVSMRLRPQEQDMFDDIANTYGFYGATNAVRAAGRILISLGMDHDTLLSLLALYEREHPEAEPCKFISTENT